MLVDENLSREGLYVGASRGAERNTMYVVTHDDGDHRSPSERPDRLGVLAGVMEREGAEQSATEVMREGSPAPRAWLAWSRSGPMSSRRQRPPKLASSC